MSKIGFIASYSDGGKSGIGQYEICLARHLLAADAEDEFVLIAREDALDFFPPASERLSISPYGSKYEKPFPNLIWHHTALPRIAKREGLHLLHLSTQQRFMSRKPCKLVGTIHDLGTYHVRNKYGKIRDIYLKRLGRAFARKLDHVISDSRFTKSDVINFFDIPEDRVTVIHLGLDFDRFHRRDRGECRNYIAEKHCIREPFLVYIARLDHPSKNHVNLLKAYSIMRTEYGIEHKLVLGGSDWFGSDKIYEAVDELGLKDHVVFTGFVPDEDLPIFYCAAEMLVFPTLFEGFGFPPLEAMACGVPVTCSRVGSVPEMVADAALMFKPTNSEEIASSVHSVLSNDELRGNLVKKGLERATHFRWEETARRTVEIYKRVLSE